METCYFAVDKTGGEYIFSGKPLRGGDFWNENKYFNEVKLPKGTIEKILGYSLTWNDAPVKYQ